MTKVSGPTHKWDVKTQLKKSKSTVAQCECVRPMIKESLFLVGPMKALRNVLSKTPYSLLSTGST